MRVGHEASVHRFVCHSHFAGLTTHIVWFLVIFFYFTANVFWSKPQRNYISESVFHLLVFHSKVQTRAAALNGVLAFLALSLPLFHGCEVKSRLVKQSSEPVLNVLHLCGALTGQSTNPLQQSLLKGFKSTLSAHTEWTCCPKCTALLSVLRWILWNLSRVPLI